MARTTTDQLLINLEARIRDFEKNMQKASVTADRQFGKMRTSASRAAKDIETRLAAIGSRTQAALGKLGVGGLVGGIIGGGVAGVISQMGDVAKGIAEIGDRAKQAGLDTSSFQKLAYVAEQNRIEVDDLTSGIREMQLRMDEFITSAGKSGSAAQSLARIGYTVDDLKKKLKDPVALFTEIIGKVKQLNESARIKVFDDLFGGDGERLVRLIDQGEQGIRAQIKAAEDLGIVLDQDVIAKAQEVDRQFNVITTTVGTHLKRAIVDAASALGEFIDSFHDFENQQNRTLNDKLVDLGQQRLDLENQILKVKERQDEATGVLAEAERKELQGTINTLQAKRDALAKDEQRILGILDKRPKALDVTVPVPSGANFSAPTPGGSSAIKEQRDRAAELIEQLKIELSLVGQGAKAQAEANALRRAGADATATQKDQIVGLVDKIYDENEAYEKQQAALREINDTGREVLGTIIDDLREGKNAGEIFADVISKIADRIENELLNAIFSVNGAGGGGGGSIFGSLLSGISSFFGGGGGGGGIDPWAGMRAAGGPVTAGKPYIVGEKRPELFVPKQSGTILPSVPTVQPAAKGGSTTMHVSVQVSGVGDKDLLAKTQQGAEMAVNQALARYDKGLPGKVAQINKDPRRR